MLILIVLSIPLAVNVLVGGAYGLDLRKAGGVGDASVSEVGLHTCG